MMNAEVTAENRPMKSIKIAAAASPIGEWPPAGYSFLLLTPREIMDRTPQLSECLGLQLRLLTPNFGPIIQNHREQVPKPNIRPMRSAEMKLDVFGRPQRNNS